MAIKRLYQISLLCLSLFLSAHAFGNPFGQTFQINTRLGYYTGKPTWLLIIRDLNSNQVTPYLYTFNNEENFWLGFTFTDSYQIMVSELKFGPPNAVIHNFCRLENRVFDKESFTINLKGNLTPNRLTTSCHLFKYKQFPFPIVVPEPEPEPESESPAPVPLTNALETVTGTGTVAPGPAANLVKAVSSAAADASPTVTKALEAAVGKTSK